MPVDLKTTEDGTRVEVELSGHLTRQDYVLLVPEIELLIKQCGPVSLLCRMRDFEGWEPGLGWDDLKFDLRHFKHIDRLAVVGDKQWEKWMSRFCRPFTTATIRYFNPNDLPAARSWVQQGATSC